MKTLKWKVKYVPYSRHEVIESVIEVVECENEVQCMNAILELVGKEQTSEMSKNENGEWEWEVEEVTTKEEFINIIENSDGDDRVLYVYDVTNKEFIGED